MFYQRRFYASNHQRYPVVFIGISCFISLFALGLSGSSFFVQEIFMGFLIITMFAVVWGLFFSPKAKYPISGSLGWLLKFCVLFIPFIPFANELPVLVITMAVITFLNLWVQSLK